MAETQVAMLFMVAAMLILPCIDAIAKWLAGSVSPVQISWSRFVFQALFLLPFAMHGGLSVPKKHIPLHAMRGTLIAITTAVFFASLGALALADAISIFFVSPLILTALSALILRERVGWRRWSAVGVGFIGALVVIRPAFEDFGLVALLPVVAAVSFAFYLLLTRRLAVEEDPVRMQFYAGIFGCLSMSCVLLVGDKLGFAATTIAWPSLSHLGLLACMGLIASTGHLLVVHAFKRAPAGALAPFQYLEIVGATLLGLFIFGDFPDLLTWFGIAIIVGAGLFVFYRERASAPEMVETHHP